MGSIKRRRLSTDEIIKRLRNPDQYNRRKQPVSPAKTRTIVPSQAATKKAAAQKKKQDMSMWVIGVVCFCLVLATFGFYMSAKQRAEAVTVDPSQVEGLAVENREFNPHRGVRYIQISEGQDRNVTVENSGSTLPILSRFNMKNFVDRDYELIGAAPWALTTNFASNPGDAELMRTLLDRDVMIKAFLRRPDVQPLLDDPQMLLAFAQDETEMASFFNSAEVQAVLQDEKMLRSTAGSRFMSHLLVSPSGKYFRNHPQEALQVINASPTLRALRQNAAVQTAVRENPYLKKLAPVLLGEETAPRP